MTGCQGHEHDSRGHGPGHDAVLSRRARLSLLYDFYGGLLTERQRQFLDWHVQQDLSFGEISRETGISRQAVHDAVRRAEEQLERFDQALGLVARFEHQQVLLQAVEELLAQAAQAQSWENVRALVRAARQRLQEAQEEL